MTTKISEQLLQKPVIGKNYIINPTFSINQRIFAGGTVADSIYTFDRWISSMDTTGDISLPDSNGYVSMTAGLSDDGIQQRLEVGQIPDGTEITLSWEGTCQVQYYNANGNAWTANLSSPATLTLDSTGSPSAFVQEYIRWTQGTLRNPKLELGATATPFEYPEVSTELHKCRRYYQKSHRLSILPTNIDSEASVFCSVAYNGNTVFQNTIQLPPMRSDSPSFVIYSPATATTNKVGRATNPNDAASEKATSSQTIRGFTSGNVTFNISVASAFTNGDGIRFHYTFDAEL